MKTLRNLIVAGMIVLASLLSIKAKADINVSLDNNFSNKYIFWGIPFSEGKVNQTMLNVNKDNFIGTLFTNYNAKDRKMNEVDIFVDYTKSIKDKLNVSLGAIYFKFKMDGNWKNCIDWYAGVRANVPLNPSLIYHKLTGFDKGDYVEGGISKDFPINNRITASTSGKLGYNNKAFREKTGFSHLEGNLKVPIKLSKNLNVTPKINYSKALANDLKNEIWGGVNVHYDF